MTPSELISELCSRGVVLETDGDHLRVNAPRGAVTPKLLEALSEQKAELLNLLRPEQTHYALASKSVLGVAQVEACLVGCGSMVKFYLHGAEALGHCSQCGVHQRIVFRVL
jgi:hypothetical protein